MERRHDLDKTMPAPEQDTRPAETPAPALGGNAAVARMSTAERTRALAGRTGGNAALARSLRMLARDDTTPATASPPGRGLCTEFGDYWIVPDGTTGVVPGVVGEQITETDFAAALAVWNKLKDGSGSVKIVESDDKAGNHPGFAAKMLVCFGKLMSKPQGRGLVSGLVNGSQVVTIGPTSSKKIAGAGFKPGALENKDGSAGVGSGTTIRLDDDLKDDAVVAFDKNGKEIPSPVWLILGHELIHAEHNAAGRNRTPLKPVGSSKFGDREEEQTIETGTGVTENKLRAEQGMPDMRFGHTGKIK